MRTKGIIHSSHPHHLPTQDSLTNDLRVRPGLSKSTAGDTAMTEAPRGCSFCQDVFTALQRSCLRPCPGHASSRCHGSGETVQVGACRNAEDLLFESGQPTCPQVSYLPERSTFTANAWWDGTCLYLLLGQNCAYFMLHRSASISLYDSSRTPPAGCSRQLRIDRA
jgi:hypothetical protein